MLKKFKKFKKIQKNSNPPKKYTSPKKLENSKTPKKSPSILGEGFTSEDRPPRLGVRRRQQSHPCRCCGSPTISNPVWGEGGFAKPQGHQRPMSYHLGGFGFPRAVSSSEPLKNARLLTRPKPLNRWLHKGRQARLRVRSSLRWHRRPKRRPGRPIRRLGSQLGRKATKMAPKKCLGNSYFPQHSRLTF